MFVMLKVKIIYICCMIFNIKTCLCRSDFLFLYSFFPLRYKVQAFLCYSFKVIKLHSVFLGNSTTADPLAKSLGLHKYFQDSILEGAADTERLSEFSGRLDSVHRTEATFRVAKDLQTTSDPESCKCMGARTPSPLTIVYVHLPYSYSLP